MSHRMNAFLERPVQQAIAYSVYSLIFIALIVLSQKSWIVLLCSFLAAITTTQAITLFVSVIFYRDVFSEKGFTRRLKVSRN